MHPTVYNEFREILSALKVKGRILEVGAVPSANSLLAMDILQGAECVGLNIAGNVGFAGGAAVIGGPGFTVESSLTELGVLVPWEDDDWKCRATSALTFRYHGAPKDYYRFSPDVFRDVIFEGYRDVTIKSIMVPPRIIGHGFKS
jgi:hypothetical protein